MIQHHLMGQSIALDRFISASMEATTISAKLTKQAYGKFWDLNPERRPDIQMSWHTKKAAPKDGDGDKK